MDKTMLDFTQSEYWSALWQTTGGITLFRNLSVIKEGWFKPSRFVKCERLTYENNKWLHTICYLSLDKLCHLESCTPSQVLDFKRNVEGITQQRAAIAERQRKEDEMRAIQLEMLKRQNDGDNWKNG